MKSMLNEREALILKEAEATATARSFPHSSLSFPHNPTAIPEGDEGYPDQLMRTGWKRGKSQREPPFLFWDVNQQGVNGGAYTRACLREGGREKEREKRGMSGTFGTAADAKVWEWDRLRETWGSEGSHVRSGVRNLRATRTGKQIHIRTQLDRWGGIRDHASALGMLTCAEHTHTHTRACTSCPQQPLWFFQIERRHTWNATVHVCWA